MQFNASAGYSSADHNVWNLLFTRQINTIRKSAYTHFAKGLNDLDFDRNKIPSFDSINQRLQKLTGWTIYPVPGLIDNRYFFEQMMDRRFGSTQWIRKIENIDYLEEPDMFHDVFGHIPLLTDPLIAEFLHDLASLAGENLENEIAIECIARLYWYTIEFGLVMEENKIKIYGAGILSSVGESAYCISDSARCDPFDLRTVLATPYIKDRFQERYFVLSGIEQLREIMTALKKIDLNLFA